MFLLSPEAFLDAIAVSVASLTEIQSRECIDHVRCNPNLISLQPRLWRKMRAHTCMF